MAGAKDIFLAWLPTNDREEMLDGRVHEGKGEGRPHHTSWMAGEPHLFILTTKWLHGLECGTQNT